MHFRHISDKIQPKNMKLCLLLVLNSARQHSILEAPTPRLRPCQIMIHLIRLSWYSFLVYFLKYCSKDKFIFENT